MRRATVLVVVAATACGGGDAQSGGAKSAKNGAHAGGNDDSIADVASREGLPSLGGGAGQTGGGSNGSLRLELADKDNPIRVDGVTKEWSLVSARTVTKGTADQLTFKCGLAYDSNYVYFATEVTGVGLRHARRFAEDEDHASLIMVAPGGSPAEITFYPGKPGELAGVVRAHGRDVPGAKLVEAENGDKGYSFEAQIPWSALAPPTIRVGLRGVARFHDGTRVVIASGNGDAQSPNDMPALPTESEEALLEQFLIPKGLSSPKFEILADIRGDAMKERVAIYDRYLTVVGPNYRDGKEFFYRDLGADVLKLEARELTGRGKQDLVIRRQFSGDGVPREWLDVWSFMSDEPTTVFSHEISVAQGSNHVTNAVRLASKEIDVTYDAAAGWDATSYKQPRASDTEPVLLPWGQVRSQTFRFDGSKFIKAHEVSQAGASPPTQTIATTTTATTTTRVEPPTPVQRSGGDLSSQLLAKYRADRGNGDRPKVDVQVHVDGDARPERVLLIGKDVVVFGPGFKGGSAYAYITLSQFVDASDIEDMTARDLTGDGAADLVVRGVRHVATSSSGTIDSHVMFVYQLKNEAIVRVFAIETARAQGGKRIQGLVQMVPGAGNRGFDIDVRPGRAQGWTDKTYPFTQDQPGGAIEPLLLPWGGIEHLVYKYNGSSFAKSP
jgi:hypothetical protein